MISVIVAYFRFPESMKHEIESKGIKPWTKGGSYRSLKHALNDAKKTAKEMNMPIEVVTMGTTRVVYPPSLSSLGYGQNTHVE